MTLFYTTKKQASQSNQRNKHGEFFFRKKGKTIEASLCDENERRRVYSCV
jgi:hypothetical protein